MRRRERPSRDPWVEEELARARFLLIYFGSILAVVIGVAALVDWLG